MYLLKASLYILSFILLFSSCHKDTQVNMPACNFVGYYYYNDAPLPLGEGMSNNYILVYFDTSYSVAAIKKYISSVSDLDQNYKYTLYNSKVAALRVNGSKTCEEITGIIANLQKDPIVSTANYTMRSPDCQSWIMTSMGNVCVYSYSNFFNVEVRDSNDLTGLYKLMAETNTEMVERNPYMPRWFALRVTKNSRGDAMHMANYFYESKLFESAEPDPVKLPVE